MSKIRFKLLTPKEVIGVNGNETQKQKSHMRMYLYNIRKEKGLSIYAVIEGLALSKPYYYQIEQGIRGHKMDVLFLNDLAVIFGIDFAFLCQAELDYQKQRRNLGIRKDKRLIIYELQD